MKLGDQERLYRKIELMRIRWGILNGRVACRDEATRDGALWWLDREIEALEKRKAASRGVGAREAAQQISLRSV